MFEFLLALSLSGAFKDNPKQFWQHEQFDGFLYPTIVYKKSTLETNGYCLITLKDPEEKLYTTNSNYNFGAYLCEMYNDGDTVNEWYNEEIVNLNKYIRKRKKYLRKSK